MMISEPGYAREALRLDQRLLRKVNQTQRIYSRPLSSPSTEIRFNGTVVPGRNHFTLCGTSDRFITLQYTAEVWTRIGRYQLTVQGLSLFMNSVPTCKRHFTPTLSLTSVNETLLREQVPGKTYIYGLHR